MAEHEGAPSAPPPDSTAADADELIADAEELERFASTPGAELTPAIRGVIAETALTSLVRYPWPLLAPVLHRLVDVALDALAAADAGRQELGPDEAGPPAPLPDGSTLEASRAGLHALLDAFPAPPFTLQRLCEILLEPGKQYTRVHKLALALERILLVTSTQEAAPAPAPPRPTLRALGPVNENPPSPYDGEPPAAPAPTAPEDHLRGGLGGALRIAIGNGGDGGGGSGGGGMGAGEGEYAIFVGAEAPSSPRGGPLPPELVTGEAAAGGVAMGMAGLVSGPPPPMAPAEVMQAEAFVQAALATPPTAAEEGAADDAEVAAADEGRPAEAAAAAAVERHARASDGGDEPPAKRQELEAAAVGSGGVRLAAAAEGEAPAGAGADEAQAEAQQGGAAGGDGPVAMETEEAPAGAAAGAAAASGDPAWI